MANKQLELFYKILRDKKYSITLPRRLIFELLLHHPPQSMHELNRRMAGRIDRASLYRVISLFENLGIVERLYIGWKYKIELSGIFSPHHHHITCLKCGKLVVLKEDSEIEQLIASLAAKNHITAAHHQLEIQGYCEKCPPVQI